MRLVAYRENESAAFVFEQPGHFLDASSNAARIKARRAVMQRGAKLRQRECAKPFCCRREEDVSNARVIPNALSYTRAITYVSRKPSERAREFSLCSRELHLSLISREYKAFFYLFKELRTTYVQIMWKIFIDAGVSDNLSRIANSDIFIAAPARKVLQTVMYMTMLQYSETAGTFHPVALGRNRPQRQTTGNYTASDRP